MFLCNSLFQWDSLQHFHSAIHNSLMLELLDLDEVPFIPLNIQAVQWRARESGYWKVSPELKIHLGHGPNSAGSWVLAVQLQLRGFLLSPPPSPFWVGKQESSQESWNVSWDKDSLLLCCRGIRLHKGKTKPKTQEKRDLCTQQTKPPKLPLHINQDKKGEFRPRDWEGDTKKIRTGNCMTYRIYCKSHKPRATPFLSYSEHDVERSI